MVRAKAVCPDRSYDNAVRQGGHQRNEGTTAGSLKMNKTCEASISAQALVRTEVKGAKQKELQCSAELRDCGERSTTPAGVCGSATIDISAAKPGRPPKEKSDRERILADGELTESSKGGQQKRSRTTSEVNSEYSDVLESDELTSENNPIVRLEVKRIYDEVRSRESKEKDQEIRKSESFKTINRESRSYRDRSKSKHMRTEKHGYSTQPPKSVGRQDSRKESRGASSERSSSQPRSRGGASNSNYQRK